MKSTTWVIARMAGKNCTDAAEEAGYTGNPPRDAYELLKDCQRLREQEAIEPGTIEMLASHYREKREELRRDLRRIGRLITACDILSCENDTNRTCVSAPFYVGTMPKCAK